MNVMWSRWARQRRLTGLAFLTGAAVAIAVAALLFFLGAGYLSGAAGVTATALIVHAGYEFFEATKYWRLSR